METVWIGEDLNGHVGDSNKGMEEIMGKYGIGDKKGAGESTVNFAQAGNLAIALTYSSGGNNT